MLSFAVSLSVSVISAEVTAMPELVSDTVIFSSPSTTSSSVGVIVSLPLALESPASLS